MIRLIYDGSFHGFLTCVIECYERKADNGAIVREVLFQPLLDEEVLKINSDPVKAQRVWLGLKRKLSPESLNNLYKTFLSEQPDMERNVLDFIRNAFQNPESAEKDFSNRARAF